MTRTAHDDETSVAVIGAGVLGLCTALELSRAGLTVTLFDKDQPALQTSFGNAAYLAVEYLDPLASPAHILSALRLSFSHKSAFKVTPDHWPAFVPWSLRFVREALPARYKRNQLAMSRLNAHAIAAWEDILHFANAQDHLHQSGFLQLWEKPHAVSQARSAQQEARRWGFDPQLLSGDALFELEPTLANGISHALYFPGARHLGDTYQTCQHLFSCFKQHGGRFKQQDILGIHPLENGASLVTRDEQHHFSKVVITAGAWSKRLVSELDLSVPLAAERGYHLTLPKAKGKLRHILSSADRHVVLSPLDCGLRIVGFGEYANLATPAVVKRYGQLRHHLGKIIADVDAEDPDIETWMGIRPTLPDSLPVIDQHPRYPQIGMAFGHHHLGVTQAAITAKMLTALMTQDKGSEVWKPFADAPDAYSVTRF
jgi:D-amino-acid dehydrogenase